MTMMTNDAAADSFESAHGGEGPDVVAELDNSDLEALILARRGAAAADAALTATVAAARAHGATWQATGAAFGMTRQAAHAKYARAS